MTEDEDQLQLPFNTGDRLPPRAAGKRMVNEVRSAVRAMRAAKNRQENLAELERLKQQQQKD